MSPLRGFSRCIVFGLPCLVQRFVTLGTVVSARNLSFQIRTYLDGGIVTGITISVKGKLVVHFRRGRLIGICDDGERFAIVTGL